MGCLLALLAAAAGLALVVYVLRGPLVWLLIGLYIRPRRGFARMEPPPAPDYSELTLWAAHPDRASRASLAPAGVEPGDRQATAEADVFYVHPTLYFSRKSWNAPLDDRKTNEMVDELVISSQASVFNASCRIYAPRYRQATFYVFLDGGSSGRQALELAYGDVADAFDTYMQHFNDGRPYFIASHSQGSAHAIRLLEERVDPRAEMRDRLVAAYVIGFALPMDKFGTSLRHLKPSERPTDSGCVVAWDTYSESGGPLHRWDRVEHWYPSAEGGRWERRSGKVPLCVNPLDWSRGLEPVGRERNLGAVHLELEAPSLSWRRLLQDQPLGLRAQALSAPLPAEVSARCGEDGYLYISEPREKALRMALLPGRSYHNYDYALFYMNLRRNVADRLAVFRPPAATRRCDRP